MYSLSDAWLEYIDILSEGGRAKWFKLRQQRSSDEIKLHEKAKHRLAAFECELRRELIARIHAGEFEAYGRNITHDNAPPLTKISSGFFNPDASDFEWDWMASSLSAFGNKIIDIAIALPEGEPPVGHAPAADSHTVNPSDGGERDKGGRPNHIGQAIREACNIAQENDSNFVNMPTKKAHQVVNHILTTLKDAPPMLKQDGANLRTFGKLFKAFRDCRTLNSQN